MKTTPVFYFPSTLSAIVLAGLCMIGASCNRTVNIQELALQVNSTEQEMQLAQQEVDSLQCCLDAISGATFPTQKAMEEAEENIQEALDGAISKQEHARQKHEAALQAYKDATDK